MFRPLLLFIFACLLVVLPYSEVHAATGLLQSAQGYEGSVKSIANLRSGPGLNYPVVDQAQPGQIVVAIGCNEDCSWLQLASGNWIAAFLVDMVALPATATRVAVPPVEQSTVTQAPVVSQPAQAPVISQPAQAPVISQPAQPQTPASTPEPDTNSRRGQILDPDKLELHEPSQAALDIVAQILSYTGLPQNFDLYSANIYNAAALMVKGKRVILYDPQLIADIESVTHRDWAAVSIFAHEIGHHLAGHTLFRDYDKANELEADYFSGFILQKMGANLEDAQAVMQVLPDHANMIDHPPQADRLQAIEAGWSESTRQEGLVAWQPTFPNFADEVTQDSLGSSPAADSASLLDALRQAQSRQLVASEAALPTQARNWHIGIQALAGAE